MKLFDDIRNNAAALSGRERMSCLFNNLYSLFDDYEDEMDQLFATLPIDVSLDQQEQADRLVFHVLYRFENEQDEEVTRSITQCERLLREMGEENQRSQFYHHVVEMFMLAQESQAAIPYALELCQIFELQHDEPRLARILNNLGVAYVNLQRTSEALPLLKRSVALNRKNDDVDLIQSYNNLASLYYRTHLNDKALATYKLALDACREFDVERMEPIILSNIANINTDLNNYEKALDYYREALRRFVSDEKARSVTLNNIGLVQFYQKNYAQAVLSFEESLQICRENRYGYTEAKNLYNLGQTHAKMQRNDVALALFQEALDKVERTGDAGMLADVKTSLALLFVEMKRFDEADKLLAESYESRRENAGQLFEVEKAYIKLYEALGDMEQVNRHQAALIELHELDYADNYTQLVAEMQTTLDLELKENEAELQRQKSVELQKKNDEIVQQKNQLERTLDELRKSEISYAFLQQEYKDQLGSIIIGESDQMKQLLSLIRLVAAASDTSVLVTGETGTGKELVARAIHEVSSRSRRTFCAVNASSVPESLFESEFFGYRKNAFTGADRDKAGWFEIANEGTLFLDEVGTWRYEIQSKFLRVLESRKIIPVGGDREIPVDFRLISATNDDLQSMIRENTFRADLYYRLSSFIIHIPPLRERIEDIAPLLEYFVKFFSQRMNKKITRIDKDVESALREYTFPGNVRELKNMVEHAMIISNTSTLRLASFPIPQQTASDDIVIPLAEQEKTMILKALNRTGYHQSNAAAMLGLTPKSLERRMKKYDIINPKRTK